MCRLAAHRTYMDTQLSKGSLICEPCLLIPHALGENHNAWFRANGSQSDLLAGHPHDGDRFCPSILPTGERADDQDLCPKRIAHGTGSDGLIHQLV